MRLKDEPESKNFLDQTLGKWADTIQGGNLLDHMLLQNDVTNGAPGGYHKWLGDTLKKMTPNDLYLMKQHGLTIEDIMKLKYIKSGEYPVDPTLYPYSDDYSNKVIKNQRNPQ